MFKFFYNDEEVVWVFYDDSYKGMYSRILWIIYSN